MKVTLTRKQLQAELERGLHRAEKAHGVRITRRSACALLKLIKANKEPAEVTINYEPNQLQGQVTTS